MAFGKLIDMECSFCHHEEVEHHPNGCYIGHLEGTLLSRSQVLDTPCPCKKFNQVVPDSQIKMSKRMLDKGRRFIESAGRSWKVKLKDIQEECD